MNAQGNPRYLFFNETDLYYSYSVIDIFQNFRNIYRFLQTISHYNEWRTVKKMLHFHIHFKHFQNYSFSLSARRKYPTSGICFSYDLNFKSHLNFSRPFVTVPLFKTYYLFLFWSDFHNPSGLIAGDSDHLCAGWWRSGLGHSPSSQSWFDDALLWRLKILHTCCVSIQGLFSSEATIRSL